ncbi:DUF5134 domain-containing protein [Streptomyces sp. NRRL F-5126]|uniref:DUF5134 domain-containing protein n=1 Tax=Streptomyces sp. NRRL F-5126 TaxID=1463857 RepID=UPI0004C69314|nr:DUF5134 domain-containing protein [Streptomyces sp. NRRL F-5126]
MHAPLLVSWLMVAVCAASGSYCLLRTRVAAGGTRATARGEALMGFGMAAMALPALVRAPPLWVWGAYAVVFGLAALRACVAVAVRGRSAGHHAHHLVGTLAMVYMSLAMGSFPAGAGSHGAMAGMGAGEVMAPAGMPVMTGVLLLYFAGYVLWAGSRLIPGIGAAPAGAPAPDGVRAVRGAAVRVAVRPEVTLACRLSMSMAMLAMLLTL